MQASQPGGEYQTRTKIEQGGSIHTVALSLLYYVYHTQEDHYSGIYHVMGNDALLVRVTGLSIGQSAS